MSFQTPKANAGTLLSDHDHVASPPRPGKSILYTIDSSGRGATDYFHKNNATIAAYAANLNDPVSKSLLSSNGAKKISLDEITAAARKRARLQRGFLEESKVNKSIARDLMNSKPLYTVEEIQGTGKTK